MRIRRVETGERVTAIYDVAASVARYMPKEKRVPRAGPEPSGTTVYHHLDELHVPSHSTLPTYVVT
jgi:hypothetical protein